MLTWQADGRPEVEGQAIQGRGPIEGEGLGRLGRRLGEVVAGPVRLAGLAEVDAQGLGVGGPRRLQGQPEATVVVA